MGISLLQKDVLKLVNLSGNFATWHGITLMHVMVLANIWKQGVQIEVSNVWYKVHTTNKINPIYLQILLF